MSVYQRAGERYWQCNFRETENFGGGSIMVWEGISYEGRTELAPVNNGRLTAPHSTRERLQNPRAPKGESSSPAFQRDKEEHGNFVLVSFFFTIGCSSR
jgi:hypothetical protein